MIIMWSEMPYKSHRYKEERQSEHQKMGSHKNIVTRRGDCVPRAGFIFLLWLFFPRELHGLQSLLW